MKARILIAICVLSVTSHAMAETDGRFLYVSESNNQTDYILSDGPGREADIETSDIDDIVKAIGELGRTGSMNYIAVRVHGQIKIDSLRPILKAIEANPTWELEVLQRGDGIRAGIALHHLDNNDPYRKQTPEQRSSEEKSH
jgi:hypothetical protein